jgi:hypothetical protein
MSASESDAPDFSPIALAHNRQIFFIAVNLYCQAYDKQCRTADVTIQRTLRFPLTGHPLCFLNKL